MSRTLLCLIASFAITAGCASSSSQQKKQDSESKSVDYRSVQGEQSETSGQSKEDASAKSSNAQPPQSASKLPGAGKSSSSSSSGSAPEAVGPIAHVDGESIEAERFNEQISQVTKHGQVPPGMLGKMTDSLIKRIIDKHLIDREIEKEQVEVPEKDIDERLQRLREEFEKTQKAKGKGGGDKSLKDAVAQMGISDKDLRDSVRDSLAIRKLLEKRGLIEKPTDEEAKDFYEKNKSKFSRPKQVHLKQIIIKADPTSGDNTWKEAKKKLESIREKIANGSKTFSEAAEEKSKGTKREGGGDLGFLTFKQIEKKLGGNFKAKIAQLDDGAVSGPIQSAYGWHLIERVETKSSETVSFEEIRSQLKRKLKSKRIKKGLDELIADLRSSSEIEVHRDNIK